jgi:hypothetical protein
MKASDIEKAQNMIADRRYLKTYVDRIRELAMSPDVRLLNVDGFREHAGYGQDHNVHLSIPEALQPRAKDEILDLFVDLARSEINRIEHELRKLGVTDFGEEKA